MRSISDAEITSDGFLNGRLTIKQPAHGYRAGVDPVLLAAAVPAKAGETALELGCGVGVAALCLAYRAGVGVTGVELQPFYAALAQANAQANALPLSVIEADLRQMPRALKAQSFDHVLANPPYFDRAQGSAAHDSGRELAMGETAELRDWVDAGVRRLRPNGRLTLIQRTQRLPDLLAACDDRLGDVTVLPLAAREGRAPERVIVQARKSGKGGFKLCQPLILHEGARHGADRESYRPEIREILRDGAALRPALMR